MPRTKPDPEATKEEVADFRIDNASRLFAERADKFTRTLRANARSVSAYKRQLTAAWLKRHCERLQATLDDASEIPPLGLTELPDLDA
jgi:hypothetical protein